MSNKNELKKIMERDFNKEKNYNAIINKMEGSNKVKGIFKIRYAYIGLILIVISVIGVSAGTAINNYWNATKNFEVEQDDKGLHIEFNDRINTDYDCNLFGENNYYTLNEIEDKLQLKFLKNKLYDKYFDSDLYKLSDYEISNNKIAQAHFNLVNSDKSLRNIAKNWYGISIRTNYTDDKYTGDFFGDREGYEEYYIKNLNTVAFIRKHTTIKGGLPVRVMFSYNNVIYSIRFEIVWPDDCYEVKSYSDPNYVPMYEKDLYEFLDSFTTE